MPRYIRHVTLTTGRVRDSYRDVVGEAAIQALLPILAHITSERGARSTPITLPGPPGYSVAGRADGHCLVATVYRDGPPSRMLVTIAVARRSRCGAAIWRALHRPDIALIAPATDPGDAPPAPWCGVLIEPELAGDPAAHWLDDLERCLAWAWIERDR